jgi:hypothetical protein
VVAVVVVHTSHGRRQRGTCSLDGCDRPHVARGSCQKHYDWQKNRRVVIEPRPTAEERFWRKVTKNRRRMLDVDRLHDRRIRPVRHRSPIGPGAAVRLGVGHRADPAWHGTRPPERLSAPLRQPRSLGAGDRSTERDLQRRAPEPHRPPLAHHTAPVCDRRLRPQARGAGRVRQARRPTSGVDTRHASPKSSAKTSTRQGAGGEREGS